MLIFFNNRIHFGNWWLLTCNNEVQQVNFCVLFICCNRRSAFTVVIGFKKETFRSLLPFLICWVVDLDLVNLQRAASQQNGEYKGHATLTTYNRLINMHTCDYIPPNIAWPLLKMTSLVTRRRLQLSSTWPFVCYSYAKSGLPYLNVQGRKFKVWGQLDSTGTKVFRSGTKITSTPDLTCHAGW